MEDYSRKRHLAAGYEFVNTPHEFRGTVREVRAIPDWYAEGMYPPMDMDHAQYYLKPMNCLMHNLIYRPRPVLLEPPLRLFEFELPTAEKSGVVQGLTRACGFTRTMRTSTAPVNPTPNSTVCRHSC